MSERDVKAEWKTTANIITIVRILFIPVFVVALLAPWPEWFFSPSAESVHGAEFVTLWVKPWIAAAIYAILALTDGVDGYIARKKNEVTTLGKFMDPLADKILVAAALLALIELGDLPSWVALIIIAREFIVSGLRMMAATEGVVVAARMSGKIKTALTLVAIILFIIKRSAWVMSFSDEMYLVVYCVAWAVMLAALVMTIVSMVQYFRDITAVIREAREKRESEAQGATFSGYSDAVAVLLDEARAKGVHIATAESCTGGMVGAAITAVPGSSDVFEGGVISYAYDVKESALGVEHAALEELGAVSEEVALQMATGALDRLLAKYDDDHAVAISVTGVAGPGQSEAKPAGTVWFGIAGRGDAKACCRHFDGDRDAVRAQTVAEALSMLIERLR